MKKLLLSIVVVYLMLFLSACQIYKNFVFRNESEREIILEYTVKSAALREGDIVNPKVESTEKSSWFAPKQWIPMSEDRYHFDKGENKFTLKINPNEAVVIESKDTYFIDKNGAEAINLLNLKIKDNGKEIYFENSERLLEEFKKNDFEIEYK